MMAECYILCEGYHDRAFWKGLLLHLGCTDPSLEGKQQVSDPWKKKVCGGQFAFISPSGRFIRIVPVGGDRHLLRKQFKSRIDMRTIEKLCALIVSADADVQNEDDNIHVALPDVVQWARDVDAQSTDAQTHVVLSDQTPVSVLAWQTNTMDPVPGVPAKQNLERLVCLAIVSAYGERAQPVEDWLASRPNPPQNDSAKSHSFSYVAGWYAASASYEGAMASIWRDERIAPILMDLLAQQPAWAAIREWLS